MRRIKIIIFSLMPVMLLLLILEITGRVIYPFEPEERAVILAKRDPRISLSYLSINANATTILQDVHGMPSRYLPFLGWLGKPNTSLTTIQTNQLGFRDRNFEPRRPGEYRIVLLGGSTA
jgi:hypothetical protein